VLAACSSGSPQRHDAATSTTVVTEPSTTATSFATAPAQCEVTALQAYAGRVGAGLGNVVWAYTIANEGPTSCLFGSSALVLTAESPEGNRVPLQVFGGVPDLPVELAPSAATRLLIQARGTCDGAGQSLPTRRYEAPALELPDGTLALDGEPLVLCDQAVSIFIDKGPIQ
jgi:hypothetical protein